MKKRDSAVYDCVRLLPLADSKVIGSSIRRIWPDPAAMVKELTEMGIHLLVSIWPTVDPRVRIISRCGAKYADPCGAWTGSTGILQGSGDLLRFYKSIRTRVRMEESERTLLQSGNSKLLAG